MQTGLNSNTTNLLAQLNALFDRTLGKQPYSNEQLIDLHMQTTNVLFQLEHTASLNESLRYYLKGCRNILGSEPYNSALHHDLCLLLLQCMSHKFSADTLPA